MATNVKSEPVQTKQLHRQGEDQQQSEEGAVRNSDDWFLTAQTPKEQISLTQYKTRLREISQSILHMGLN
eukprot:13473646-Ditylum_brightwellii.AAC.1